MLSIKATQAQIGEEISGSSSIVGHCPPKDVLSQLPYEILEMILEYLWEKDDAASMRSVSKIFYQLKGPTIHLFQTTGLYLTSQSVDRLENISRHQHRGRHVKRLIFFPPLLDDPEGPSKDLLEWRGFMCSWTAFDYW